MNPKGFQLILNKLLGNQDTKALVMLSQALPGYNEDIQVTDGRKKIMLGTLHFAKLITSFSLTKHLSQIKTSFSESKISALQIDVFP